MIHLHQQSQTDKIVPLPSFLPSQEPHKQSSRFIRPTALSRDDKILRRFKKHTLRPNKHEDTPPTTTTSPFLNQIIEFGVALSKGTVHYDLHHYNHALLSIQPSILH